MKHLLIICVIVISAGCVANLEPVFVPEVDGSFIQGHTPLDVNSKKALIDGVYKVDSQLSTTDQFGDVISVRLASNGDVNLYAAKGVSFFVVRGGTRSDTGVFVGRWRGVQGPTAGEIKIIVLPEEGGESLAQTSGTFKKMILRCKITVGNSAPRDLVLERRAALNEDLRNFQIIAHRGGGRNSERLGVSENSLPMIRLAEQLGSTSIEIDVRATKDGIPIVFHDATFTPRTVLGSYIIGDIRNYTLQQLRDHCRLANSERIPTLDEALDEVIHQTELSMVWLDVKDATITNKIIDAQIAKSMEAEGAGRDMRFLFGIPDSDVLSQYEQSPRKSEIETLCELDATIAESIDAAVWAPRFTAGVQRAEAERMRDQGRDVYVWTLDDPEFIRLFLEERHKGGPLYNGILTNYPTLLAARFYSLKFKP